MWYLISLPRSDVHFGRLHICAESRHNTNAELHWQESKWVEALRKCALSMAAVAAVSAPLSFAPQEVLAQAALLSASIFASVALVIMHVLTSVWTGVPASCGPETLLLTLIHC